MKRYDKPDPVWVRWVDSCQVFGGGWADPESLDDEESEAFCETLGWLVGENDHSLYVAGSIGAEEIGSVVQIPKSVVKECWPAVFEREFAVADE